VKIAVIGEQYPQWLAEKIAAHRNTVEQLVGHPPCGFRGCGQPATTQLLVYRGDGHYGEVDSCDRHATTSGTCKIGEYVMPNAKNELP